MPEPCPAGHMECSLATGEPAFALLDQVPDLVEEKRAIGLRRVVPRRIFQIYNGSAVLANITIDIPAGTCVGDIPKSSLFASVTRRSSAGDLTKGGVRNEELQA